ncbi:MAG: cytochrome b N-terminal domain-containing protein [Elusimicrobia bacterium]|nr:cytochrome b N-terminal domain-containing protein [Elusimicrobiota bacterium]MDE2314625.1 cytochrome b N-terminal domain-containing protein [Elusimicrobiota bacterium]
MPDIEELKQEVVNSQIWRSIFRGGLWSDTPRDRANHMIGNVWLHIQPTKVRKRALEWTYTWGLGGLSFFLFLVLVCSGVLLMFYYRPVPNLAFRDIKDLTYAVTMGKFLRNIHRWAAQAMVMVVILHMLRVFLTGSYKRPREFNWCVGVLLLTLTMFLSFTGYLLPWDQLALWAVTVGTNMAGATPFIGNAGPFGASVMHMSMNNDIRFVLLGGTTVGANTLVRFYVMHCVAVPLLLGVLIILHFWRVRKDGFSAAPYGEVTEPKIDTWPNLIKRQYVAAAACLLILMIWALMVNAPLDVIANPHATPNPEKAPWYFVGLQDMLYYFDPWIAGVMVPNLIIVGLMAIPFIDPSPKGVGRYALKERPFASTMFLMGILLWFAFIFMGEFCRGPNFMWYWPWQSWLMQMPAPKEAWSLFGPHGVGRYPTAAGLAVLAAGFGAIMVLPKMIKAQLSLIKATLACAVGLGLFILILHYGLHMDFGQGGWIFGFGLFVAFFGVLIPQRYIRNLDWARYLVTMALVASMMGLFVKICAREAFNIKYLVTMPAIYLNI